MLECVDEYLGESRTFHGSIRRVMGTSLEMIAVGTPQEEARRVWDWLCVEAEYLDRMLDRFREDSEVSRVNAEAQASPVAISPRFAGILRLAMSWYRKTCGCFDVTKGGMEETRLDEDDHLFLGSHTLDFGGFAKGYLLSLLKARISSSGIGSAFVDFGGSSILTVGHHPFGDCWKVGVRNPFEGGVVCDVPLVGQSLSTSGNTPSYGGHIINPSTGEAVTGRCMAIVVSSDPLEAEILSTAVLVADENTAQTFAKNFLDAAIRKIIL